MLIHVGYSTERSIAEIIEMIDVDVDPNQPSEFRLAFGAGYLWPGSFEVYGPERLPDRWTKS